LLIENSFRSVCFNNLDAFNCQYYLEEEAISMMSSKTRGLWQSLDKPVQIGRHPCVAENFGLIVFKDRNVVTFYSNDLAETSTSPIQEPNQETKCCCVCGLAALK
jgi:hypothetical protein